jgi:hypothetical protein
MRNFARGLVTLAIVAVPCLRGDACTTAVISGAVAADGRPILWKNRDADDLHNQVVYRADGRFAYIGIVNQADTAGLEVWAGINEAGFAIMNSASYNLEEMDSVAEGQMMKVALQSCRTVADFQRLLDITNTGVRSTTANFGVIDAEGGAAIFETGASGYTRFDASTAPTGVLVRTNYSDSGDSTLGSGLTRRARAEALIRQLQGAGRLTARHLFAHVCRDVANANTGSDPLAAKPPEARFAYVGDSINRDITASAVVFVGVRAAENPLTSTAWVILGQPVTGAAVPLWVHAGSVPDAVAAGKDPAPLNAAFDRIRGLLFPSRRGELKRYLEISGLTDGSHGVHAPLLDVESSNFETADSTLDRWRSVLPPPSEAAGLQTTLAGRTLKASQDLAAAREGATAP